MPESSGRKHKLQIKNKYSKHFVPFEEGFQ